MNHDELIHPSNEAIRPRPHLGILEDISMGFHVLGGCGALERWIKILQQTQNKIGIDQTELDIKQEETLWWIANIAKLWEIVSEEKLPFERLQLEQEGEIGPIKYVAEMIYGQDDANKYIDNAVRYVIIALIFVFDPLALLLLITATSLLANYKEPERPKIVVRVPKTNINK